METLPNHPLIEVTSDDVTKAREFYEINDVTRIKQSLDTIYEWCNKQDHLVNALKVMDRNLLERILILSRGSVEAAKTKIDKLLTSRGMMPELALNKSVEEFELLWDYGLYVPLPKLHKVDQSRVMVTQFLSEKLDAFSLLSYFRYAFMIGEYRLHYDYCLSERYIIDLTNIHVGLVTKVNPMVVKKAEVLCTEGFGTKIKGIHLLNAPPFVDKIVFLIKQGLKEKVASRLHVHNSYADLHKHIPKEILPKDFDGDGPSLIKLAEQWKETLKTEEAKKIIKDMDQLVADESRRSSSKFNEEYLGMPGSFRKLNVD
ncbi:uncharacterized protein LOC125063050 [Pieris napi]|uniref:uncharacterized protein LOC125063050 n=1 Tax=Pieris napi TaxID=78633 RepID=UPI001FB90C90|nr:uncharacterized protein LOC125063050 [Pieris napi]XP_047525223.1 uncharacterized protein LOC125063050 [Pieris napi]XP_047525224.1 uncharacterized protein LOC125063050 [Pieris napi]